MSDQDKRYFLRLTGHEMEQEVTRKEWLDAERAAGFRPKSGDPNDEATAGFSSGGVTGTVRFATEFGDIPNISTPRATIQELEKLALDGINKERAMTTVFFDFCSNVLNHATPRADAKLLDLVEKAHREFKEAVK